jgi:hypothetical protein
LISTSGSEFDSRCLNLSFFLDVFFGITPFVSLPVCPCLSVIIDLLFDPSPWAYASQSMEGSHDINLPEYNKLMAEGDKLESAGAFQKAIDFYSKVRDTLC